ncbi:MAG: transglutaminase family protein [Deinococcales bacterium]
MSIDVAINHKTHYHYDRPVALSPHIFRLRPAVHSRTPIKAYSLNIKPEKHFINWQQDAFGNYLARVVFPEKTTELAIEVDIIADMTIVNPFDFFVEEDANHYPFHYKPQEAKELSPYLEIIESGPRLQAWLQGLKVEKQAIVDFLVMVNQKLWQDIAYSIRMEPGVQSCEETLGKAIGSCRDSAWVLVQALRHLGLAARFVSGYLVQLKADVASLDGPSGPSKDFTDLHAWAEVYVPGAGWLGLDATSGLFAGEGHIPLACTPDPISAAPVTGMSDKAEVTFSFNNSVQRIREDPRVSKPYNEAQWQAVEKLAAQIDLELQDGDVRLTMGGEPTFVSIDDMEAAEWNISADGPQKRKLANELIKRLHQRFAQGGFRHYAQGKWYPGEPLPRWSLAVYWRKDKETLWRNPDLLADIDEAYSVNLATAKSFLETLSNYLAVPQSCIQAAYEDVIYFLWAEQKVPKNLDPLKANLKDSLERQRLAELLNQGLGEAIGFVLPLEWDYLNNRWQSQHWLFRRQQLYLIPGNSPLGLRLPLDELDSQDEQLAFEPSPLEPVPPLGDLHAQVKARYQKALKSEGGVLAPHLIRTALAVEIRQGKVFVFLPPVGSLEPFLDLIASIELSAQALSLPIILEGYTPPSDPRLEKILVTPDPGVIEVNIYPSANWPELRHVTESLYDEARQARLGTEKFMLDGRHTGTGGGNHVTLGGRTPSDSPFLRRPDLLRSLITYWQHHPGLSYLFAGMFIGPTSQAPRVDEGRLEKLYELEIAFSQLPKKGEQAPPWKVDRILRNLLVDITGNTHRSEFSIDKLYSPDGNQGRLGLVEFRAFDMPPHAQMSLVQMLLIRSLIAWFWREPYEGKLIRWGTALHDRFLMPHYVERDLRDVCEQLKHKGYGFEFSWLGPFFEFRFPRYGTALVQDMELEVRMAIEPWHVLGEEMSSSGTARYVDSSVERVQLKVKGLTEDRYILACNGQKLPLHPTGTHGEYVAAVRYQAWQPPSSLHPTIAVQSPLVFDMVDTWHGRAIGGCTYHVSHPGGRSYEDVPVNANVAEARRVSRFWDHGYTPSVAYLNTTPPPSERRFVKGGSQDEVIKLSPEDLNPEYPHTLDLRRRL